MRQDLAPYCARSAAPPPPCVESDSVVSIGGVAHAETDAPRARNASQSSGAGSGPGSWLLLGEGESRQRSPGTGMLTSALAEGTRAPRPAAAAYPAQRTDACWPFVPSSSARPPAREG